MSQVMPHLSGAEATQKMRDQGYDGLVIGVTGNALPEDIQDFLDHGADGVVSKPFDMEVFKSKVAEARERNGSVRIFRK